ncbi:MAG: hypothetical protein H8E66_09785 [Planctomycetes bacterium]|nr:hypothetical protein [Planctomycetota bacterium]
MNKPQSEVDLTAVDSPHFTLPVKMEEIPAWEEVAEGRFMPRRVRGSYQGRALG